MLLYHLRRPWALPLLLSLTLLYVTLPAGCSDDGAADCGSRLCGQDIAVSDGSLDGADSSRADRGARDQLAPDSGVEDLIEADLVEADLVGADLTVDLMAHDLSGPDAPVTDTMSSPPDGSSGDGPYVHEDITPQTLSGLLQSGSPLTLLDVREPGELASGKIAGSINKPWISGVLQQDFASNVRAGDGSLSDESVNREITAASKVVLNGARIIGRWRTKASSS